MTDAAWESLSNQAVAAAGLLYFLALLSHLVEWASLRKVPVATGAAALDRSGGGEVSVVVDELVDTLQASSNQGRQHQREDGSS